MARPIKITEETKLYNLKMPIRQFVFLDGMAEQMNKRSLEQVSVADLIRDAIEIYIDAVSGDKEEQ
tara:strand:+ start:432 stop:629 length:198 start_codon:yes stop_codon:yes gene_type:complete